ncbi:MAG: hypothetical protein UT66_C0018G0002 [candidate division CPR2 bacterium GW2011_GWC1_39_9]|nr:MAG: hypothetical protein UT66_C0018G0002 [candidate division CPR2 bacterium GW2011_GWC1_39_9]
MDVVASGLNQGSKKQFYTSGGVPISEGDLVKENDTISLVCSDLSQYPIFSNLIPLEDWVGKKIARIRKIAGSKLVFEPGSSFSGEGEVRVIYFADGTKSTFFINGSQVIGSFEGREAPDIDLLIKAGMLNKESKREREEEVILHKELRDQDKSLTKQRAELQESLVTAGRRDGHAIYKQIEHVEAELTKVKNSLNSYPWKWSGWVFDLRYLTSWIPDLVDLFEWRRNGSNYGRKTYRMLHPDGKQVVAVHKIFDASKSDRSKDVYSLEFSDGSFSAPLGLCSSLYLRLPLEELLAAGIITKQQLDEAEKKLGIVNIKEEIKKYDSDCLKELQEELKQFRLGEKRTRKILEEIAILQEKE